MMKTYTYLLLLFLLSFCTVAQTVKRSKVVSNGGVHGMAYHPNVGMVVLHSGTHLGFPALNAQEVNKETGNPISVDFPFLDGFQDAVSDDIGGWFIVKGGTFYKVDEYVFPANKYTEILHLKADYSIDTTFRMQKNNVFPTNFQGGIIQIIKYQDLLLTWCSLANGNVRLLAFDATNGNLLWDSKTEASFQNLKMQVSQNRLYITGNFTKVNDIATTTTKAICFNLDSKILTNWNPTATLNLQGGYGINDMTLGGDKSFFSIDGYHRIVAIDTTTGATKLWDEVYDGISGTKMVANDTNLYILSQNLHIENQIFRQPFSKIAKINALNGQIDNSWTIATKFNTRLFNIFLDGNFIYATADPNVTILGSKISKTVKINHISRTIENWEPFNNPNINAFSEPIYDIYGNTSENSGKELKIFISSTKVLIGGNYGLLKQNKKEGIALIRPESESVIDWKPNVKQFSGYSPSFENDSTLWVWGDIMDNSNTSFQRQLVAFDIRTGDMIHHFPVQIQANEIVKKISVAEGKIIVSVNTSFFSAGTDGYLQTYNSTTGVKGSWITGSIINNFQVVDSLLYFCGGSVNLGVQTKQNLGCINLKTNQFVDMNVEFPAGTDLNTTGAYRDFVITGRKVITAYGFTNNPKSYFEFDRFTGKLLSTFGTNTERSNFITAGEKYFFLASNNGGDMSAKCDSSSTSFYYDLEYKKFSSDCFLKKTNSAQRGVSISQQFFLAQNYLYLNLSWEGNDAPIGAEQNSFLRTSFPKGFFKDEINPAFFPKTGGNSGFVTVNFYGYSYVEGCKIRLKKAGEEDIVILDSMVVYPEKFRMEVKLDLRNKVIGDWDVEVILPNGEKSYFVKGFTIRKGKPADIHIEFNSPSAARMGGKIWVTLLATNKGEMDAENVPFWIVTSDNVKIISSSKKITAENIISIDTSYYVKTDSLNGIPFLGKVYYLVIPKLRTHEVFTTNFRLQFPLGSLQETQIFAFPGNPLRETNLTTENFKLFRNRNTKINSSSPPTAADCFNATWGPLFGECPGSLLGMFTNISNSVNDPSNSMGGIVVDAFGSLLLTGLECYRSVSKIVFEKAAVNIIDNLVSGANTVNSFFLDGEEAYVTCRDYLFSQMNGDLVNVKKITSFDPNDKLGPVGVKAQKYVNGTDPFTYKIRFENFATATAAAQYVRLVDTLDRTKFNFDTFQFGYFNVADTNFYASPGKKRHLVDWDLRPAKDLILRMEAKFIDSTGILDATYSALDPATMEWTEDPILGFLPPNLNAPEGEGSLTFSIFPKDSLVTGTTISNKAYIYFDYNPVIPTPPWVNTIDATLPSSSMTALPVISRDTTFTISWQGSDFESGAKLYDVMVSVNDNPYQPVLLSSKFTNFKFIGKMDSTYKFYTVAYDSVYNKESIPITFLTQTTVKFYPNIQSISSGAWNSPATWDCNCIPTLNENVVIKNGHKVITTAEMDGVCKKLLVEQGAVFEGNGKFKADSRE
jgi:hypothetical protein